MCFLFFVHSPLLLLCYVPGGVHGATVISNSKKQKVTTKLPNSPLLDVLLEKDYITRIDKIDGIGQGHPFFQQ